MHGTDSIIHSVFVVYFFGCQMCIIMYMVYLVHEHYMYQIMLACNSSTVHVYDLLDKLPTADNYLR